MSNTPRSDKNSVEWDRANRDGCDLEFAQGLEQEVILWKTRAFRRRQFSTEILSEKLQLEEDLGRSRETIERQAGTIAKLREESNMGNDVALQMTVRLHQVADERDELKIANNEILGAFKAIEGFKEYLFERVGSLEERLREQELNGDSISQASVRGSFCEAREIRTRFQRAFNIFESAISKIRKIDSKIP